MDIEDIVLYASFAFLAFVLTILACFELYYRLRNINIIKGWNSLNAKLHLSLIDRSF